MLSDETTNVSELKQVIKQFCEARDWDKYHNPKDLAIGVVTEASELLEVFRFKSHRESCSLLDSPDSRQAVSDELADVLFFILRLAQMNSIDLTEALRGKIAKNAVRYPAP